MTPEQRFLADLKKKGLRPFIGGAPFNDGTTPIVPPLLIFGSAAAANVGDSTPFSPTISGGVPPYALGLAPGSNPLPSGRTIVSNSVVGTYTAAGNFAFILRVTDSAGTTADLPVTQSVASVGPVTRASISSINVTGWDGQDSAPPAGSAYNIATDIVQTQRQGFDNTGTAKTYPETVFITKRVRTPGTTNLSASRAAFSAQLYSTDTVAGVTNNSAVTSPQPIAHWQRPDRQTVGNTIRCEIVATHINARNLEGVACVIFAATDGTTTVTQTVGQSSILAHPGDKAAVTGYEANLDITSLADKSAITVNAKVYPWIGGAAAVLDSALKADGTANTAGSRSFCPQVYYKNVALTTTYPQAYVSAGASGGAVSTVKNTAKSQPFPDVASALSALQTFAAANTGIAPNGVSGCHVVLAAGTQVFGTLAGSYTATAGELIIEGDPDVADKTTCIISYGATTTVGVPYLRLQNLREVRNTNYWELRAGTNGFGTRESMTFDNTNGAAGPINAASRPWRYIGVTHVGAVVNNLSGDIRLLRGFSGTGLTTTIGWNMVGCSTTGGFFGSTAIGLTDDGTFVGFNLLMGLNNTWFNPASAANVTGLAIVQNVREYIGPANAPMYRPSGDGQTGNCTNFVEFYNSDCGGGQNGGGGRLNAFYDEKVGTNRKHTLIASKGNIYVQLNQKSDLFLLNGTDNADAPNHVGAWSFYYGADCQGNISQYVNAFGAPSDTAAASQAYTGPGSLFGTNSAAVDPKFKSDQGMSPKTPAPLSANINTVGTGGSDLHTLLGSPAKGIVSSAALRFDLDGKPRSAANDDCGAYLVAAA